MTSAQRAAALYQPHPGRRIPHRLASPSSAVRIFQLRFSMFFIFQQRCPIEDDHNYQGGRRRREENGGGEGDMNSLSRGRAPNKVRSTTVTQRSPVTRARRAEVKNSAVAHRGAAGSLPPQNSSGLVPPGTIVPQAQQTMSLSEKAHPQTSQYVVPPANR